MTKLSATESIMRKVKKELDKDNKKNLQTKLKMSDILTPPINPKEYYKLKWEHDSRKRGNQIMQQKKRDIHNTVDDLIRQGGYKKPQRYINPESYIIESLKNDYKSKTGKKFPRSDKTLEKWIYDYFNKPGN
ncbi:MAG: hypothetical protein IJS34_01005 [Alphaproteobacteria bacterium]|nr:hypothetical protein [Alphaproteobacteria bacterium]